MMKFLISPFILLIPILLAFIVIFVISIIDIESESVSNLNGSLLCNTYKGKMENLESCLYFFDSQNAVWIEKTIEKTSDVSFALSSVEPVNTVYFFAPLNYSIEDNKIKIKEELSKKIFFKPCNSMIGSSDHTVIRKFNKDAISVLQDHNITKFTIRNRKEILK